MRRWDADRIEVKIVGDYLGDKEAEVLLTRQGLAGVRRCDGADLPQWSAYVPYSFAREQLVIQAGVNEWGTAGPNAGYAAWPVHGEQWTLTIPPPTTPPRISISTSRTSPRRRTAPASPRGHHRAGRAGHPHPELRMIAMPTHHIIPASALRPGLATIIVSLPIARSAVACSWSRFGPMAPCRSRSPPGDMLTL